MRQNYVLFWSLVKNSCVTAERVPPGPKNVKLNLLTQITANSQLELSYKTVCFEGQGQSPFPHDLTHTDMSKTYPLN